MKQTHQPLFRVISSVFVLGLLFALWGSTYKPVQAAVNCSAPGIVCVYDPITTNTTWTPGHIYVVLESLTIESGATLTIEGGNSTDRTIVKMELGTYIEAVGSLVVTSSGGGSHEVLITSLRNDEIGGDTNGDSNNTTAAPGDWDSIIIYNSTSSIDRAAISFSSRGIVVWNETVLEVSPDITNSLFTQNTYGITLVNRYSGGGDIASEIRGNSFVSNEYGLITMHYGSTATGSARPQLLGNSFTGNLGYPIFLSGSALPIFGTGTQENDFIGYPNSNQRLAIGLGGRFLVDGTLPLIYDGQASNKLLPYAVLDNWTIASGYTLALPAGAVVKVDTGYSINVAGGLTLNSVTGSPITFTSLKDDTVIDDTNGDSTDTQPAPGDWAQILFSGPDPEVHDLIVKYATNGVYLYNSEYPIIEGNQFTNNLTALYFESTSGVVSQPKLNYNLFQNNFSFPIVLNGTTYWFQRLENTFSGHLHPGIGLLGTWVDTGAWEDIQGDTETFPYVVIGNVTVATDANVSVPPGIVFKFDRGGAPAFARYFIDAQGTVALQSTDIAPIIFTSYKDDTIKGDTNADGTATIPAQGDWAGFYLYDSLDDFHDAEVRYAYDGLTVYNSTATLINPEISNVTFYSNYNGVTLWANDDGNITSSITDCVFNSNTNGLYTKAHVVRTGASNPTLTNNAFINQAQFPIYLTGTAYPSYINNTFANNHFRGIGLAGYFNATGTLERIIGENGKYFPYIVDKTVVIAPSAVLTLPADSIVKFQLRQTVSEQRRNLDVLGQLVLGSYSGHPIVFTSLYDDYYDDTNNDGGATLPAVGDWDSVYLENTSNDFKYVISKYGLAGVTVLSSDNNLSPAIHDNLFQNNNIGIYLNILGLGDITSLIERNQLIQNEYGLYTSVSTCYSSYSGIARPTLNNNSFSGYKNVSGHHDFPIYLGGTAEPILGTGGAANTFVNHTYPAVGIGGLWCGSLSHPTAVWQQIAGEGGTPFPYVVVDSVLQTFASTIQIPANTIIKLDTDQAIHISGVLDILSTNESNRVNFTSFKDDSLAGDTNADGTSTSPSPTDWDAIWIYDISSKVNNIHDINLQYATAGLAYYYDGPENNHINPQITDSTLSNNWVGMLFTIGYQGPPNSRPGKGNINAVVNGVLFDTNYYDIVTYAHPSSTGVIQPVLSNNTFSNTYYYPLFLGGTAFPQFQQKNNMVNVGSGLSDLNTDTFAPVSLNNVMSFDDSWNSWATLNEAQTQPTSSVIITGNAPDALDLNLAGIPAIGLGGVYNMNCNLQDVYCTLPGFQDMPFAISGNFPLVIYINGQPFKAYDNLVIGATLPDPSNPEFTHLIFPAGAVIKLGEDLFIDAFGELDTSLGTLEDPIVFTSIRNDAVGGDTNDDGNATLPAPGDWDGIYLESSATKLEDAVIQYSANGVFVYYASGDGNSAISPEITSSIFTNNIVGISLWAAGAGHIDSYIHENLFINNQIHIYGHINQSYSGAPVTGQLRVNIDRNDFLFDTELGVYNDALNCTLDAENNYWDSVNGPTPPGTPEIDGVPVSLRVDYTPWLTGPVFATQTYQIQGRVVNVAGSPVPNVQVTLSTGAIATTNVEGYYSFTGLDLGVYSLSYFLSGYIFNPPSNSVSVPPDAELEDVIAIVNTAPTYNITGQVLDPLSLPVEGVLLTLSFDNGFSYTSTSPNGAYAFTDLLAGTYTVTPSYQSYTFNPPSRTVVVGPHATGVNFIINAAVGEGFRL
ncbi:MAG TPA: carboxypeptidase regulatory-like domain-containing protein, partial [Anaerolineaceae bacterium]|nr:carboxypeptidase regulatory-like domain-containing protein [Anaerolineaceae bacterium]